MLRRSQKIVLKPDQDEEAFRADLDAPAPTPPPAASPPPVERRKGERRGSEAVRTEFQRSLAMAEQHNSDIPSVNGWSLGTRLRIALVVLAVIAGGLAAYLALQHEQAPAPVEQVAAATPPPAPVAAARVLVAKTAIGLGERLSSGTVEWQDWPENAVRPDYITIAATPTAVDDMSGSVARSEFASGEPILKSKLVATSQGYMSAVLDSGMRGVAVSVTAESASGGFVFPNDHVDVVLSRTLPAGQVSQTILQNVRVLAINTRLGETGTTGAPTDANDLKADVFLAQAIATLELDKTQTEVIINAMGAGKLSLVLRSVDDYSRAGKSESEAANESIRMTSPFWTR